MSETIKPNLLFIAPWVPAKQRPRSLGLLRALLTKFEVVAVVQIWSANDRAEAVELGRLLDGLTVVTVEEKKVFGAVRAGIALFSRRSLQQAFTTSARMRRAIRTAEELVNPSVSYFNVIRSAQFVSESRGVRVVDLDEFRSDYYLQLAQSSRNPAWRALGAIEAKRLALAERRVLSEFDVVLVSSPAEMRPDSQTRLVLSPHALDTDAGPLDEVLASSQTSSDLIFVGRLSYRANAEAVDWLARSLMPRLLARRPEAVLRVVGRDPGKSIRALSTDRIDIVGTVPDVSRYYRHAAVSLVPIRMATGIQMKLIESATLGAPIITSPVSAHRAGLTHGHDCLVADTTDEWVDAIDLLLENSELSSRLVDQARLWAQKFSQILVADSLHDALDL